MLNVLGKADVLSPPQLEEVIGWAEDRERLYEAVTRDVPTPDVQLSTELFRAIENMGPLAALVPTSAKEGTGMDAFYQSCQRVFAGGEDLEPSHAPSNE